MNRFSRITIFSSLLSGAFCPLAGYAQDSGKAEEIIAASRAATGGANWDQIKTWQETGKIIQGGLEGTYQVWADFPSVLAADMFRLGPVKGSAGWNGKESWTTDSGDQLRIETSRASIANAIKFAYKGMYTFYFPNRYPAELKYVNSVYRRSGQK